MGFLNPLLLLGVLSAAIPVLIHLWSRRRARTLEFSALRFLLAAAQSSARRFRLEQLLLLALRCLALALIALAAARPVLKGAAAFGETRAQTAAAIVLDRSASMGCKGVAGVPFEAAKERALEILRSLQPGDAASIVLMSDRPAVLFEPPTTRIDEAVRAVESAELELRGTRPETSIRRAAELLSRSRSPNRELYILSDFTRNGWEDVRVAVDSARVFLMPFRAAGAGAPENASVSAFEMDNPIAAAGTPVEFRAVVQNDGPAPAKRRLEFFAEGERRGSASAEIPPGAAVEKRFSHVFGAAGTYEARVSIEQDRFPADDERRAVVQAQGQIDAFLIGPNTTHLALALNPTLDPQPQSVYAFRAASLSEAEAASRSFDGADLLILQDPPLNDARLNSRLRNWLLSGKPILLFLGGRADSASAPDWLPVAVGGVERSESGLKLRPAHLSDAAAEESRLLFGIFEGDPWQRRGAPSFFRYRKLTPAPNARLLSAFSNGETAMAIDRRLGGACAVVNTPGFDQESSNFTLNPSFPPLAQQLALLALRPETPTPRVLEAGTPFRLPLKPSDPAAYETTAPDGSKRFVGRSPDGSEMAYPWTDAAGLYRVTGSGGFSDLFVVNAPSAESNLEPLDRQACLDAVDGAAAWIEEETREAPGWDLQKERLGREIWAELLLIAALMLAAESFLSNRALRREPSTGSG